MTEIWKAIALILVIYCAGILVSAVFERNYPLLFMAGGLFVFFYGGINRDSPLMFVGFATMMGSLVDWSEWSKIFRRRK